MTDPIMLVRKATVAGLEWACGLVHLTYRIPVLRNYTCCWLAAWSAQLDDRWHTGWWKEPTDAAPDHND